MQYADSFQELKRAHIQRNILEGTDFLNLQGPSRYRVRRRSHRTLRAARRNRDGVDGFRRRDNDPSRRVFCRSSGRRSSVGRVVDGHKGR